MHGPDEVLRLLLRCSLIAAVDGCQRLPAPRPAGSATRRRACGRHSRVHLDRPRRDEERLRDLAVGQPAGRHRGDPAFARRERGGAGEHEPARPRTGRDQLLVRVFGEQVRARALRELERVAQPLARRRRFRPRSGPGSARRAPASAAHPTHARAPPPHGRARAPRRGHRAPGARAHGGQLLGALQQRRRRSGTRHGSDHNRKSCGFSYGVSSS